MGGGGCLCPILLRRLGHIRENTCAMQRWPDRLPECSNIWQRNKWIQEEHLHRSERPSLQTFLMKVVTVPNYRAALLMQDRLKTD